VYLPLIYRGDRLNALVIGGGKIATRKVMDLIQAGAKVSVITQECLPELEDYIKQHEIELEIRSYKEGDCLNGKDGAYSLIVVATNNNELNIAVSEEARHHGIPVNVVDVPELCTVYFAAVVRKDPMMMAISSGGNAPFIARELKKDALAVLDKWEVRAKWGEIFRVFVRENVENFDERMRMYELFMGISGETMSSWDKHNPPYDIWKAFHKSVKMERND